MKSASAATLAILASGQFIVHGFYRFTLVDGTNLYFTDADVPLTVAGQAYSTQLVIRRGPLTQKIGLDAESFTLEIAPQRDHASGTPTFGGYPFMRAGQLGIFDGAKVLYSKGFFNPPTSAAPAIDTTPGIVPWWFGDVNDVRPGRSSATFTVKSFLARLNVAMPRTILQVGCVHTLYDAGCGLTKGAAATSAAAAVTGSPTNRIFTSNITTPTNGFYDLGTITFLTGALAGLSRTVKAYSFSSGGRFELVNPLPAAPAVGDTFRAYAGCDKQQATCSSKFSNLARFRGFPYIPVPETLYAGGAVAGSAPSLGGQGGGSVGSPISSGVPISYVP